MKRTIRLNPSPVALAAAAALGAVALVAAPGDASAGKKEGQYVAGDFHNHTTCSDGSTSLQKLVRKSTDRTTTPWGLDWFVQAGHGGNGNRNCTLVEDASLDTPAYPFVTGQGPTTTWAQSIGTANVKGDLSGSAADPRMWRWQSLQEFQYPLMEYLNARLDKPLFMGVESVVAGHEHTSMSVITGQIPKAVEKLKSKDLPTGPGYVALGNANALAQWQYCFDRAVSDTSRGNITTQPGNVNSTIGNNWDCSVPGSLNIADPNWVDAAKKIVPTNKSNTGVGSEGHLKTLEALKWMKQFHPEASYYVPAHLERAGPFNPVGNNGFNVEHLRNFNNTAPAVAFGFETQPGHGASSERGEYFPGRNNFGGGVLVDSVGGTTYGGTGVYGAQVGGVWDALLGEGRNWWFFASSDWHNRGQFGPDDLRSSQDFYPGEYQRNYTMVRSGDKNKKLSPQMIVDGLRTGNNWASSGQLIDRLAFVACAVKPLKASDKPKKDDDAEKVEKMALKAATENTDVDDKDCATMGEKLVVKAGSDVVVALVVRDPNGTNFSPYSFANPSLAQVNVVQPLNRPVLDHVDVIGGLVTGYRQPGSADYAGEWPRTWLTSVLAGTASLSSVPPAARNTSARVLRTFDKAGWSTDKDDAQFKVMSFRIAGVKASQYLRARGTNLPPNLPFETDADGNPLPDVHTNATTTTATSLGTLKIQCNATGSFVPAVGTPVPPGSPPIDGCPSHLPTMGGQKYVAYDVAAWADLWFYANPIYIEVAGSTMVAGVR